MQVWAFILYIYYERPGEHNMPRKETKDVYQIRGYEVIVKKVTPAGTSGKIYLPVDWIGKRVKVVRFD